MTKLTRSVNYFNFQKWITNGKSNNKFEFEYCSKISCQHSHCLCGQGVSIVIAYADKVSAYSLPMRTRCQHSHCPCGQGVSIVIAYADKVSAEHALHGQGILYLAKIACLCSCWLPKHTNFELCNRISLQKWKSSRNCFSPLVLIEYSKQTIGIELS